MTRNPLVRRRLKVARLLALAVGFALGVGALAGLHRVQVRRHAGALLDRATAAVKINDIKVAADLFKNYLKFRPDDAEALSAYAAAVEAAADARPGAASEAIGLYQTLGRLDALTDAQRRRLARHYVTVENYPAARDALADLTRAAPAADPELLELAAGCDEAERKFGPAIDTLRKAVATGTASAGVYTRLAYLLRTRPAPRRPNRMPRRSSTI